MQILIRYSMQVPIDLVEKKMDINKKNGNKKY